MLKKVSLATFVLLFTFMSTVLAHTGLESSTPQNGDVVNEELQQITLNFEGKIEQGSTFTIQDATGTAVTVNNIAINDNVLSGEPASPLENGEYTVKWSIIGEDGHLVEDSFTFNVDVPAETVVEETTIENETTANEDSENDGVVTTQDVTTETNEENEVGTGNETENNLDATEDEGDSTVLYILIGALIIIVIISFVLLSKRKK